MSDSENPTYIKLLTLLDQGQEKWMDEWLNDPHYTGEVDVSLRKYMLDAIWPEIESLLSSVSLIINDEFHNTTSITRTRALADKLVQEGEHVEDWCVVND